jgi:hypothetical protein
LHPNLVFVVVACHVFDTNGSNLFLLVRIYLECD